MKAELQRRVSLASKLEAYLKARPGIWIPLHELAAVGGLGGFRTRLSELGRRQVDPMHLEWNGHNGIDSAHRYLPYEPIGRDASQPLARPVQQEFFR